MERRHSIEPRSTPPPAILECKVASSKEFQGGQRYQLIPIGPTFPGGERGTYQNSLDTDRVTFRVLINSADQNAIVLTLINLKSQADGAPENKDSQIGLYRINLFDKKGKAHSTILWLNGHDKCRYTIHSPPTIDDYFVANVVMMNMIPAAK